MPNSAFAPRRMVAKRTCEAETAINSATFSRKSCREFRLYRQDQASAPAGDRSANDPERTLEELDQARDAAGEDDVPVVGKRDRAGRPSFLSGINVSERPNGEPIR